MFAGFRGGDFQGVAEAWVPVVLRAGRNQVLLKTQITNAWCQFRFHDAPDRRAFALWEMGLWAEAADCFAEMDRRAPLEIWRATCRIRCLLAARRNDEARQVFDLAVLSHGHDTSESSLANLGWACPLPPRKDAERDRWVSFQQKLTDKEPTAEHYFWLGHAEFRAAKFDEAEKHIRQAIARGRQQSVFSDQLCFHPLLASTLHYLGLRGRGA